MRARFGPDTSSYAILTGVIGRTTELRSVQRRIDAVASGRGSVVFVAGEPGIGKSTFASEIAHEAARRGITTAWGRCREVRGAPAMWPWVHALTALGLHDRATIEAVTGPAAGDVALVLGGQITEQPDDRDSGASASRRFRLFHGLATLLGSRTDPTCIVIDDLHRADEESIGFLEHLADVIESAPIVVVGTFRDGEVSAGSALQGAIGRLVTQPTCDYLSLRTLPADEARELAMFLTAGDELDTDLIERAVERSTGHPFFLEQLVRAGLTGDEATLPPTIREAVRYRIERLGEATARTMGAAAVIGREFTIDEVAFVSGEPSRTVVDAVGPAIDAQLIDLDGGDMRFRHVIVRDVLYGELPLAIRRSAHERMATYPVFRRPTDDERVARAHHAVAASELGADVDVVGYSYDAGRAVADRLGPAEAADWFDVALTAASGTGAEHAASLALEAGEAHLRAGRTDVARARFEQAFDTAHGLGDAQVMAAAALAVGRCVVTAGDVDRGLVDLLERAHASLPDDHRDQARLLARHGIELYWRDGERSRELTEQALALVDAAADPKVRAEVLFARLFCLRGPGRLGERLAIGSEIVELASLEHLDDDEFRGRTWLIPELLQVPDLPAYESQVAALTQIAERSGQPLHRWYADLYRAQAAIARGEHASGRELAESARRAGLRSQAPVAAVYHVGHEFLIRRDLGDLDAIVDDLREVSARFPAFATLRALLGLVYIELGERDRAVAEVVRLAHQRFSAVPQDSLWIATLGICAEVSFHTRLDATGKLLVSLLRPHAGTCAVQGLPTCFGAVDRYLGLAMAAAGDHDGAREHLGRALEQHQQWGFVPFELRTELDLARLDVRNGPLTPGERDRLVAGLQRARDRAANLGYERLARQVVDLIDRAMASEASRPSGPGGTLSDRETEVLGLIAQGATNKELATRLHISVNTVERHVRNIFTKLGVTNRVEASAAFLRHCAAQDHGSP